MRKPARPRAGVARRSFMGVSVGYSQACMEHIMLMQSEFSEQGDPGSPVEQVLLRFSHNGASIWLQSVSKLQGSPALPS